MSFYEKSYWHWLWKSNQKRLLILLIILITMFALPAVFDQIVATTQIYDMREVPFRWTLSLVVFVLFAMALLLPALLFRYTTNKRSADLYLSMPIKRTHFFWLQYGFGLCIMLLPCIVYVVITLITPSNWEYWLFHIAAVFGIYLIAVAFYAILTFFVSKCNSFWDIVCVSVCILLLSILLVATMDGLANKVVQQVIHQYNAREFFPLSAMSHYCSPIIAATDFVASLYSASLTNTDQVGGFWREWSQYGGFSILIFVYWAIIAVGLSFFSMRTYTRRSGEDSEQKTTSKMVYPFLITMITSCLIFQNITDFGLFWLTILIYFVLHFIAERKIHVHWRMFVALALMAIFSYATTYVLIETKGFGRIQDVIEREKITQANVSFHFREPVIFELTNPRYQEYQGSYINIVDCEKDVSDPEIIDEIYELQSIASDHNHYLYDNEEGITFSLNYTLTNGSNSNRAYYLSTKVEMERAMKIAQYLLDHGLSNTYGFMDQSIEQ